MKNIFSLYKLRMKETIKNAVLVIPAVLLLAFLGIMYSIRPVQVSGSFLISGIFLFVLATYIANSIQEKENDVHEEILLLHSNSSLNYYISREMVLIGVILIFAAVLIAYPAIRSLINSSNFTRPMEKADVIWGGLIVLGNGLCGIAVGDLCHQRIVFTRRYRLTAVFCIIIITICKTPLIHSFKFLTFLNYLLPPVTDGLTMVGNTDYFDGAGSTMIFIHTLIFLVVITILKIKILKFKKYNN